MTLGHPQWQHKATGCGDGCNTPFSCPRLSHRVFNRVRKRYFEMMIRCSHGWSISKIDSLCLHTHYVRWRIVWHKPIENGINRPSCALIPTMHIVWRGIVETLIGGEKSPLFRTHFSAGSCTSWLLILTKSLLCAMSPQNGVNHPSCGAHPHIPMA